MPNRLMRNVDARASDGKMKTLPLFMLVVISVMMAMAAPQAKALTSAQVKELGNQAHVARDSGNYLKAISLYKEILRVDPDDPKILTNIGRIESDAGNYRIPTSYFKQVLSTAPKHQGALFGLGEIMELMGDNSSAKSYFEQVLAQPATADFEKLDHALSLMHLGNYSQALQIVDSVLKTRPSYMDAIHARGEILLYQQNYEGALKIFNQILTTYPNLTAAIYNKCISLEGLGNNEAALKCFQYFLSKNPSDVYSWYQIGYLLARTGNWSQALLADNMALALHHPPSFKIHDLEWNRNLTLGVVLLKSGSFSQAIQVFNAMLKVSPHDPTILQVLNYAKSKLFGSR